jgi:hypothetical protein
MTSETERSQRSHWNVSKMGLRPMVRFEYVSARGDWNVYFIYV